MNDYFFSILCCPYCYGDLERQINSLFCDSCEKAYEVIDGIPIFLFGNTTKEDKISSEKWHKVWDEFDWETERLQYNKNNTPYILKHLTRLSSGALFLEIGSGPSFLAFYLANRYGLKVICVDFDFEVLERAKKHFQKHGVEGFFVCADIAHLPLRNETIDISAGIGVLEHSLHIELSIRELFRVTKRGGYTLQTVPALSLLTFTLNQRHGVIPRLPILREIFLFLHKNIFKTRFMKHGYEEQFTESFIRRLFFKAGFSKIESGFYDFNQTIARKIFGNLLRGLIKLRPFWDIIFIRAEKE